MAVKKFNFENSKMADSRHIEIDKLQYLMMMQNGSLKRIGRPPSLSFKFLFCKDRFT